MASFILYLILGLIGLVGTSVLLNRLFNKSGGSVARDFEQKVAEAKELEQEILKLKKESVRDTIDFQDALKKYRAKYGGSGNGDTPKGPA